jgi:hypothetical protein
LNQAPLSSGVDAVRDRSAATVTRPSPNESGPDGSVWADATLAINISPLAKAKI